MKINEVLKKAEKLLNESDIEEANLKAKLLLLHILDITKEEYIIIKNEKICDENKFEYFNKIEELRQGKPLEYITGKVLFLGNEYIVNENVLIPRLDTEVLVEKALEIIKKYNLKRVLEIGTGSGIIGIHLSLNSDVEVIATDISKEALKIAEENAKKLNVDFNRYELLESDIYKNIGESFDLIISNPPYIKTEELNNLNKDVLKEPHIALDGGKDGLDFYKKIIEDAFKHVKGYGSFLILEIGFDLATDVIDILEENNWKNIKVFTDLSGLDRMIVAEI